MNDHVPGGHPDAPDDRLDGDELVAAVLDGLASPAQARRVADDPALSARLASFRRIRATLLAEAGAVDRSPAASDPVASALARSGGDAKPPHAPVASLADRRRRGRARVGGGLAAAAAVLVVVVAAVAVGTQPSPDADRAGGASAESAATSPDSPTTTVAAPTPPPPAGDVSEDRASAPAAGVAPPGTVPDLGDAVDPTELLARWSATSAARSLPADGATGTMGDGGTAGAAAQPAAPCDVTVLATGTVGGRAAVVVATAGGPTVLDAASCAPLPAGP